ncbi:MAG: SDR family oxidoreductase [Candidatus Binataceae bacterium]
MSELDIVTGAFGYTGRYIAQTLLEMGRRVRTLTAHPRESDPLAGRIEVAPFNFDNPSALAKSLEGADTVYNTYWIRFPHKGLTFDTAVANNKALIQAAKAAGVRKYIHISIANASVDSPLPYFRGKGLVERALSESGLPYAILRPTVIFGAEDVLINNIAWLVRRSPVFAVAGRGDYRLQPIFVEDLAKSAVEMATGEGSATIDAGGLETFTFNQLVRLIAKATGNRVVIIHLPDMALVLCAGAIGLMRHDVMLTRDEMRALSGGLLVAKGTPLGTTPLSLWLERHNTQVGVGYSSELARRSKRNAGG